MREPNRDLEPLKAKARELKAQGLPLKEIARVMGLKEGRVTYYIYGRRLGEKGPLVGKEAVVAVDKRNTPGKQAENIVLAAKVADLMKQNYSYPEMADKLGISKSRVGYLALKVKHGEMPIVASSNGHSDMSDLERHISFAAGHISAWLEVYADSLNVPRRSLSEGVMGVLKARR